MQQETKRVYVHVNNFIHPGAPGGNNNKKYRSVGDPWLFMIHQLIIPILDASERHENPHRQQTTAEACSQQPTHHFSTLLTGVQSLILGCARLPICKCVYVQIYLSRYSTICMRIPICPVHCTHLTCMFFYMCCMF